MKALILSADNFEDSELLVPLYRLQEAGYKVDVAAVEMGSIIGKHGYEVQVNKTFAIWQFCCLSVLPPFL